MTPAIAVDRLTKRYRERVALSQLSFTVAPGEIVGLLGPNGAGKSTTIGILATLLRFDAGTVSIRGHSLPAKAAAARRVLGLVPQQVALYPALTATENLHFFARAQGIAARDAPAAVGHALDLIGLADRAHEPVLQFSIGMRRRLSLAAGILHGPEVVLLDEPTVGVDPHSRERVFAAVLGLARAGAAVLYSTHQMDEAERLCDRLLVLDHGQLLAAGTPTALVAGSGLQPQVRLRTARPLPDGWLGDVTGAAPLASAAQLATVAVRDATVAPAVLAAAVRGGGEVLEFALTRPNLNDAFFALTGRALRDDAPD
jgi:ABC-2 type transport system ATP-binding protein